ncbi:TadE/TadG family type IV pilus assembly protein [Kitasatospora sp. MBT63]|uniref:TadE/TadG family type IV pilus assembly protein n=1 Tax=Kitasatospora sp. MBT63 TaxID=1444768 RepID=UPI0007C6506A|nr:TadE/TadG family type IV pilus assembly protein [Kitasatospora sp. MBT63]
MTLKPLSRLRRPARDRGALSLEFAVLIPAVFVLIGLIAIAGRVTGAGNTVDSAARAAARAASLERDGATARSKAQAVANDMLAGQGIRCVSSSVDVPTAGFQAPLGTAASVTVTVTCQVNLADIAFPGAPGTKQLRASFTSPLDPYRQRP